MQGMSRNNEREGRLTINTRGKNSNGALAKLKSNGRSLDHKASNGNTNLAQWFKSTKLTEENVAEEKAIMSKAETPKVETPKAETPKRSQFEESVDLFQKAKQC